MSADDAAPRVRAVLARRPVARTGRAAAPGLGLAIVAAIAEAHGGTAEVADRAGRGRDVPRHPPAAPRPRRDDRTTSGASESPGRRGRSRRGNPRGRQPTYSDDELAEVVAGEEADERFGRAVEPVEHVLAALELAVGEPVGELGGGLVRSGPSGRGC